MFSRWGINSRRGSIGLSAILTVTLVATFAVLSIGTRSNAAPAAPSAARHLASTTGTTISTRTTSLGLIAVGPKHHTVYLFTKDGSGTSHCGATCRKTWHPVKTSGKPNAGTGIKQTHLGQTSSHQVTYYHHPLYTFAGDSQAGQTKGQGATAFGGRWWVVAPDGTAGTGTKLVLHSTDDGNAVAGSTLHNHAVYMLASDSATHSTCTASGGCTGSWPPVITTGKPRAGSGVTAKITTLVRGNGTRQVVYNGHPVYYYVGDSAAGQDNGQCQTFPDNWFILHPGGTAIKTGANCTDTSPTSTPTTSGPPPPSCTHPGDGVLTTVSATLSHTTGTTSGVLAGSDGCTVYMFQKDETAPVGQSHCTTAGCANTWPPVTTATATGFSAQGGAVLAKIDTIPRGTGYQLTYNGYPLYYYAPDHTPAHDATAASGLGNGAFSNAEYWYALVGADGSKICGNSTFCH